jgi:hypothetical protein
VSHTNELLDLLQAHIFHELGDMASAHALSSFLYDDALSWKASEIEAGLIKTILAFTFGNRMQPNGNRTPGPVNEAIANVAISVQRATGATIYAQWEVAEAIGNTVLREKLVAIYPDRDKNAEPVYLSTGGTIRRVIDIVGDAASLGVVGIIGFRDHLRRCVTTARAFGIDAYAPAGHAMPDAYDAYSGQPWCRNRTAYLMHDIAIRAAERRDRLTQDCN